VKEFPEFFVPLVTFCDSALNLSNVCIIVHIIYIVFLSYLIELFDSLGNILTAYIMNKQLKWWSLCGKGSEQLLSTQTSHKRLGIELESTRLSADINYS
jgi:hypothetical protein